MYGYLSTFIHGTIGFKAMFNIAYLYCECRIFFSLFAYVLLKFNISFIKLRFSFLFLCYNRLSLTNIIVCKNLLRNEMFYAVDTFYLRLYGIRHMVKDHSDCEIGNLLPSHGLLFPISSKGSFICIIPQTG